MDELAVDEMDDGCWTNAERDGRASPMEMVMESCWMHEMVDGRGMDGLAHDGRTGCDVHNGVWYMERKSAWRRKNQMMAEVRFRNEDIGQNGILHNVPPMDEVRSRVYRGLQISAY